MSEQQMVPLSGVRIIVKRRFPGDDFEPEVYEVYPIKSKDDTAKKSLIKLLREIIKKIDHMGPDDIEEMKALVLPLRKLGITPGMHVGNNELVEGSFDSVAWYAGQLLSIIDRRQWLGMNMFIHNMDRFTPEDTS